MDTTLSHVSPELRLLLACCRMAIAIDEQKRQRAYADCRQSSSSATLDWPTVMALADMHKIYPLLYQGLRQANALNFVPPNIRQRLQQICQHHVQRAMQQTSELVRLGKLFQTQSIPVMPLKGPLLAQRLFSDVGRRQPGDLDLLVQPADLDKAERVLSAAGYRKWRPYFPFTPRQQRIFMQITHHYNFVHPETKTGVELHWKPFANDHLLPDAYLHQMRQRTASLPIGNVYFSQFADTDLLLYLCLHGAKHQWYRLKWLCDIAAILHRDWPIDGSLWQQMIAALGLEQPVGESFVLAQHFLAAPLPPQSSSMSNNEKFYAQTVQRFSHRFAIDIQTATGGRKVNRIKLATIFSRPALRQDLTYRWHEWHNLWYMVDDWRDFPLPDSLFPLYYVLRPFFWFWRYYIPLPPYPYLQPDDAKSLSEKLFSRDRDLTGRVP